MQNSRKTSLVLGTVLILTFGILEVTAVQLDVLAQNMTDGNNMTASGNMTDTEQSGGVSGIAINEKGKPAEGKGR